MAPENTWKWKRVDPKPAQRTVTKKKSKLKKPFQIKIQKSLNGDSKKNGAGNEIWRIPEIFENCGRVRASWDLFGILETFGYVWVRWARCQFNRRPPANPWIRPSVNLSAAAVSRSSIWYIGCSVASAVRLPSWKATHPRTKDDELTAEK